MLLWGCNKPVQVSQKPDHADSVLLQPEIAKLGPDDTLSPLPEANPVLLIPQRDYEKFQFLIFSKDADRSYDMHVFNAVNDFYTANGHRTIWLGSKAPTESFHIYPSLNKLAWSHGLDSTIYRIHELTGAVNKAYSTGDLQELATLDFQITFSFFLLSHHLAYGKINPQRLDSLWFVDRSDLNVFAGADLLRLHEKDDFENYFDRIQPPHEQYAKLKNKLEEIRYQKILYGGKRLNLSLEEPLRGGEQMKEVKAIRERLSWSDTTLLNTEHVDIYDEDLQKAVRHFQESRGLIVDGIVGRQTLKYLSEPLDHCINVIRLNMDRIRWMPRDFSENYLLINIPDYSLRLFQKGRETLDMKVIVGEIMNKTPVFSDTLEYIVFSPTWVIPQSIKVKEMLPRLQKDSSYYSNRDYKFYESWTSSKEVDPDTIDWGQVDATNFVYNIVQQPGPNNALGRVKFIMPNDLYIYLHDTPADRLFTQPKRSFSHGCIRLEKPLELAEYLLKDEFLRPRSKIERLIREDEPQKVVLNKPYHVQIMYRTAWVDSQGVLQQREDVYGLDSAQWLTFIQ